MPKSEAQNMIFGNLVATYDGVFDIGDPWLNGFTRPLMWRWGAHLRLL